MKQLFTLLSICVSTLSFAQSNVRVDEIQELSAIVWRLAKCEEYNTRINPQYLSDVETYFADFKEHPVMDFIREVRAGKKLESGKKYGIAIPSSLYNKNGINTADDYVYEFYVK